MKLLEEFWYGNIEPTEYDTFACKVIQRNISLDYQEQRKASGYHDGCTERTVFPIYGRCS